jgi:hypothetical protein
VWALPGKATIRRSERGVPEEDDDEAADRAPPPRAHACMHARARAFGEARLGWLCVLRGGGAGRAGASSVVTAHATHASIPCWRGGGGGGGLDPGPGGWRERSARAGVGDEETVTERAPMGPGGHALHASCRAVAGWLVQWARVGSAMHACMHV